jgi:hypothetical protein
MKDEIRSRLERALSSDQAKRDEHEAARKKTSDDAKSVVALWSQHITTELLPALAPIQEMLKPTGWIVKIDTPPNILEIAIFRGDMRSVAGQGRPSLKLELTPSRAGIVIYQATASVGGPDPKEFKVSDITADFLQDRVAKFIEALTR